MNWRRWVLVCVAAVMIAIVEVHILSSLPSPWNRFHPILGVMIIFITLDKEWEACIYAGIAALIVSLYSLEASSYLSLGYLGIMFVSSVLSRSVFTNRSMYAAVVLTVVARILFTAWSWIVVFCENFFRDTTFQPASLIWSMEIAIGDVIFVGCLFMCLALFTRRFLFTLPRQRNYYDNA